MTGYDIMMYSFVDELEKLANSKAGALGEAVTHAFNPGEVAEHVVRNQRLRQAANPDLMQKLRPGTGSLFGAIRDRLSNSAGGFRTRSAASGQMARELAAANPNKAKNIVEQGEFLQRQGAIREAERKMHGVGSAPNVLGAEAKKSNFWGSSAPANAVDGGGSHTVRNVAFGAGIGAAGLGGAQYAINQHNQAPQY